MRLYGDEAAAVAATAPPFFMYVKIYFFSVQRIKIGSDRIEIIMNVGLF